LYEATWVNPLREFLTAGTSQAAIRILEQVPVVVEPEVARLIDKFIREAGEENDLGRAAPPAGTPQAAGRLSRKNK
jgi:hypothetical protein